MLQQRTTQRVDRNEHDLIRLKAIKAVLENRLIGFEIAPMFSGGEVLGTRKFKLRMSDHPTVFATLRDVMETFIFEDPA